MGGGGGIPVSIKYLSAERGAWGPLENALNTIRSCNWNNKIILALTKAYSNGKVKPSAGYIIKICCIKLLWVEWLMRKANL